MSCLDTFYNIVYYTSENDRVLEFSEFEDADYSSINIDEPDAFDITINDSSGIAVSNGEYTNITWYVDNTYLYLHFSGNLDEAKRIAESVKLLT